VRARLKIFFDGGCRGGVLETAVVAAGRVTIATDLGQGTSTDAEWLALIRALEVARALGAEDFVLIGDCADVIAKANGRLRCRGTCEDHRRHFAALANDAFPPRIRWIKRSQNLAGIALAQRHPR
jgi:ribonuclease HI